MIKCENLTLTYTVYYDKSFTLKERVINFLHRRKFAKSPVKTHDALSNLNLKIESGERVGIIGHNGAGKSTLLKVISGILKPTKGSIHIEGTVQPLIEISAGFNPEFSGRENIFMNGYMLGFTKRQIRIKEQEIINFADIRDFIDVPVKYYSSGMSMRLAFTIATSIRPDILILDEMLSAGDVKFFAKAQARLNNLVQKARTVVIVSHDLDFIKNFATRVIVLDRGQVVFDGDPVEAIDFYVALSSEVQGAKIVVTKQIRDFEILSAERGGGTHRLRARANFQDFQANPFEPLEFEVLYLSHLYRGKAHFNKSGPSLEQLSTAALSLTINLSRDQYDKRRSPVVLKMSKDESERGIKSYVGHCEMEESGDVGTAVPEHLEMELELGSFTG